ncbi:uncharacterized protein LOC113381258 [Ctenocephalides felis]|uniref:uncharacterized protein LOC113381258 n=1 Tax=Ctenocephalides felis TaxID=7515 RepID=UPI000E6E3E6E|nr:uncharacterized protein LOC113381258 [Ctenocephalides felis]
MKVITIDENESAISVCRRVLSGSETDERIQETEQLSMVLYGQKLPKVVLQEGHHLIVSSRCTEEEGSRISEYDWTTSLPEIRAFIGILYARGAYESLNMCQAAFESPWINSSKRIKNALRLLMARSQKPLVFQAGFYPMNLRAFITILRGAYSAFTVMRQVDK